jgi:hypothetical protein
MVAALALAVVPAGAQEATIMGPGAATCGVFAQEYRRDPVRVEVEFFYWAAGFMSASNIWRGLDGLPAVDLRRLDWDLQKRHIRNFCDANPLKDYVDAAVDLYRKMGTDQGVMAP